MLQEEAHCPASSAPMALWPPINPASSPGDGMGTFSRAPAPLTLLCGAAGGPEPSTAACCLGRSARARLYLCPPRLTAPVSQLPSTQAGTVGPGSRRAGATKKSGLHSHLPKSSRIPCLPPSPSRLPPPQSPLGVGGRGPCPQKGEICMRTADLLPFFGLSPVQAAPSP